jgi:hypothetical protein
LTDSDEHVSKLIVRAPAGNGLCTLNHPQFR